MRFVNLFFNIKRLTSEWIVDFEVIKMLIIIAFFFNEQHDLRQSCRILQTFVIPFPLK